MVKKRFWNLLCIIFSLILALGLNNTLRQISAVFDTGLIFFLTFGSIVFVLGALVYTIDRDKEDQNKHLALRFILSGIFIIFPKSNKRKIEQNSWNKQRTH